MKEILYVLTDKYADHEAAFLSQAINSDERGLIENPKYINKIVAKSMCPVSSIGGFRTLPDYTFETLPKDYAAVVLVGGMGWLTPEADVALKLVSEAVAKGKIVGAICNAATWLAKHGLLNEVKHTGNGIEQLNHWGAKNYTNQKGYINAQAVSDKNIVTANGSGQLEFACELLRLLENDTPQRIEQYYQYNKVGMVELFTPKRFDFNTVGLFTTDNRKMVDFYTKVFGFTTTWDGVQPNVEMYMGKMRIILFPRADFERMTSQQYSYPKGYNGTMELAIDVPTFADVDREYYNALSLGAISVMPPITEPWGQRTCYVADPEGNLIEISSFVE